LLEAGGWGCCAFTRSDHCVAERHSRTTHCNSRLVDFCHPAAFSCFSVCSPEELQLNRRLGAPRSSVPPLWSLLPVPSRAGAAVIADVIATRHHWCYDNNKPSLS
ncbi:unnamed protein product, partial [Pleuronectes platessa]